MVIIQTPDLLSLADSKLHSSDRMYYYYYYYCNRAGNITELCTLPDDKANNLQQQAAHTVFLGHLMLGARC